MKNLSSLFLLFWVAIFILSMKKMDNFYGEYKIVSHKSSESIVLKEGGGFEYTMKQEFLKISKKGNWQVRNDSILVLDSYPQKEKLIVFESYRRKYSGRTKIVVRNKRREKMFFQLTVFKHDGSSLTLNDQWDSSIIDGQVKSFSVVDTKGLSSPIYEIISDVTNHFEAFLEISRVFENEEWIILPEKIRPIGMDGKYVKYYLKKQ
jgi:hypothetical protein